ncbi:MAG: HAD family hydrolase [Candidatus Acidiferrales bacterium]
MKRLRFPARAVLFDWDGTLLNSYAADARAYLAMFSAMGIDWNLQDLARHYSPNWYRVYRAARLPRARWDEADRHWTLAYNKEAPGLLPGARSVLRMLDRNFLLGIVTSGNRTRVRRQLRHFELADYFAACVCGEDAPRKKPHPAPLELALTRLRADPEECIYVGDTAEDIEMARRAGVRPIGVLGPFPTAERVRAAHPDVLLQTIRDLPQYLRVSIEPGE